MNLDKNADIKELKTVMKRSCKDRNETHILWVDKFGEVYFSPLKDHILPAKWAEAMNDVLQFRIEPFQKSSGFDCSDISMDDKLLNKILTSLETHWHKKSAGEVTLIN